MKKESKPVLLALLLVLAIIFVLLALSFVLRPYYLGKATESVSDLSGESAPSIASIPGDVSSCQIIDYGPGIYTLDRNLAVSGTACLDIRANDIVIDCQGNSITGDGSGTGLIAQNVMNITVLNCLLVNLNNSINIMNSSGSTVTNNFMSGISGAGVRIFLNSTNNIVQNNILSSTTGALGISIETESRGNAIQNNNLSYGSVGIYIARGSNNALSGNNISYADYGIKLYNASRNSLSSNILESSNAGGLYLNTSSYTSLNYDSFDGAEIYLSNHSTFNNVVSGDDFYVFSSTNVTVYNASAKGSGGIIVNGCMGINVSRSALGNRLSLSNSFYCNLFNNSIVGAPTGTGIALSNVSHSAILNNSVKDNDEAGIVVHSGMNNSVSFNILVNNGFANDGIGGIIAEDSTGNNISFNTFSGNKPYSIFVSAPVDAGCKNIILNNSDSSNNKIEFYNATVNLENVSDSEIILCSAQYSYIGFTNVTGGGGFLLVKTNNARILNSTSFSNANAIALYNSSNNTFENFASVSTQNISVYFEFLSLNNRLLKMSMTNRFSGAYDIQFADSINGTVINETHFERYDFGSLGGKITLGNAYGSIKFLTAINGSGSNLSADIAIGNNSASLNSAQTGLNKSANITFYGIRTDFVRPAILRDNYLCPAAVCRNFTGLNAGTVMFNVTGWTNYSIAEGYNELTSCGVLSQNDSTYRLLQPVSVNGTCFEITASNITLDCLNWSNMIVYGNSSSTISYQGIYSNASKTKVRNCAVTMGELADGTLERYAIYYHDGPYGEITNSNASWNRQGIVVNSSLNNITGNIANYNSQTGIYLISNSNNTVMNNSANNNKFGIRIYWLSDNNTMTNNTANSNSEAGIYLGPNADNNYIAFNNATNNKYGIAVVDSLSNRVLSNKLDGNSYSLFLNGSSSNTISLNRAGGNSISGMFITGSSNSNTIDSNNISDCFQDGITVSGTGNIIRYNNVTNSKIGVYVKDSANNVVTNRFQNDSTGILIWSDSNTISGNIVVNSTAGISINGSSNNFAANNITGNYNGITILFSTCTGNSFSSNFVLNNSGYGILINAGSNNLIYNNYFNNTKNANDLGINNWNTSRTMGPAIHGGSYLGGNFWSDYAGWDIDGDGLGNTRVPYNSSNNISNGGDYLPLTKVNSVPSMNLVFVNSTLGTNLTTENLTCWANATEIDLDNVTYYGRWYKNGVLNLSFSTGHYPQGILVNVSNISHFITRKGENWSCEVMASDGEYNSSYLMSNNLTILNSAPYFNPNLADKTVTENSSLYYDINCSDADNDVLVYTINDSSKFNINSADGIIGGVPGFDDAGIYYYNVSCGDNEANASQIFMINVTNTNRIPELISLVVNSTYGTNTIYENITCSANATDADGGNLNYTGAWYRNGAANISFSFNDSASGALANLSTLENSSFSIGENWTCYARVYDGENYSNYMRSNGVVILAVCGNAVCESGAGESCGSCPADCSCPSGGGGGGGGGKSPSTYSPSESQLAGGYTNNYYENDRMRFSFGNEIHYISVDNIEANSVTITIYSLPMRITLFLGEPKKVDIDGDGYYDLLLRFEALRSTSADILVQRIFESVSGPAYVPPQPPQPEQPKEQVPPAPPEKVPEAQAGANTLLIVVIVLAVLIVLIILSIILIKLKAKRDRLRMIENAKKWVEDARKKGYSNKAINRILFKKDWTLDEIKEVMGHHHSEHEHKLGK